MLNPNPPAKVERSGWHFSLRDQVMATQNDYDREVLNGAPGTVVRTVDVDGVLITSFERREVSYPFGELDTLVRACATTIHKSQGSDNPAVIFSIVYTRAKGASSSDLGRLKRSDRLGRYWHRDRGQRPHRSNDNRGAAPEWGLRRNLGKKGPRTRHLHSEGSDR